MSTTPFSVTAGETFTMFDVLVTDAAGKQKEYGYQCGGGRQTAEQAAKMIEERNMFPGAKEVKITPARSQVPQMSIEKRIEQQRKAGLRPKQYVTPKPSIGKVKVEEPASSPEDEIAPERTPSGDPVTTEPTVTPVTAKKK